RGFFFVRAKPEQKKERPKIKILDLGFGIDYRLSIIDDRKTAKIDQSLIPHSRPASMCLSSFDSWKIIQ
ncbi:MAG: hypothetical protein K5636_01585, partial [Bacteroidales bacterium]|nr:hypothetical protein [Bacteroidales bacterium]